MAALPALGADEMLACVRRHRERFDHEISAEYGWPIDAVRRIGAELASNGRVIACTITRFNEGDAHDASFYRIAGYMPPAAPGRKARPTSSSS